MATPRDPMFHALENVRGANKWRKELAGTPTYVAAAMLSWHYAESTVLGSFLVFVCFMVIYHYVYEFLFPEFDSRKNRLRLMIFFAAQLAFWVVVFLLWFILRRRVGL
jgi:hypothetical protein